MAHRPDQPADPHDQGFHLHNYAVARRPPPVHTPDHRPHLEPRTEGPVDLDDDSVWDLGVAPARRVVVARYLACAVIPWRLLTRAEVVTATADPRPSVRSRARRALRRIDNGR